MNNQLRNFISVGIIVEIGIFLGCYFLHSDINEVFRHAARYSGRVSALIFFSSFYVYASSYPKAVETNSLLRNLLMIFGILHLIHFGFLATNVYLNEIPLEAVKVAGGALAYLMIVAAPFILHKLKVHFQLIYFYYVSLVMILTYLARIKGDFEGAEPFWFHYLAIGSFVFACLGFAWMIFNQSRKLAS